MKNPLIHFSQTVGFRKTFRMSGMFLLLTTPLLSYHLNNQEVANMAQKGEQAKRLDVTNFFHKTGLPPFNQETVSINPLVLQKAAASALRYFNENRNTHAKILSPSVFSKNIMTPEDVKKTLQFIIWSIETDKKVGRSYRILDPKFLNKHFKFIRWHGDVSSAYKNKVVIPENADRGKIPKGKIRLTNYAVFELEGNYIKTREMPYPLYHVVDPKFYRKEIFKYTKQDIVNGILEKYENSKKVKPLVWLSRDGLEEAIMQGSAFVRMPDGKTRLFNVDKNNGFSYDKKIKDAKDQKRYWYFREISKKDIKTKKGIHINHGGCIFAGDLYNIGLGKIIALRYQNPLTKKDEIRLGVLADSGGALTNNLYQLDLFAGIFKNRIQFHDWIKQLPNAVEAYILIKV
jgi:membrane-bound lytic murein transglycosylase